MKPTNNVFIKLTVFISVCIAMALLSGCAIESTAYFITEKKYSPQMLQGVEKPADPLLAGFANAKNLCVVTKDYIPEGAETYYSAALFDLDNRCVRYASNVHEKRTPASVTKILTALVALKYGNLDDTVTVSDHVRITEYGAKLCGFEPGDTLSLRDALNGLLIYSGNDAGVVIAEHISGSVEAFAGLMNVEAAKLGATNTHFVNPHGLTANEHYTTAYDLYLIFRELMDYPEFLEIIKSRSYTCNVTKADGITQKSLTWASTNRYFDGSAPSPDGVTVVGGKTGYTIAAGGCLILLCEDNEAHPYISVVLNAPDKEQIYTETSKILLEIAK